MTPRGGRALAAGVLALWFAVPLLPIVMWAFADRWSFPAVLPQQWGTRGWALAADQGALDALGRSVMLALLVAVLAVLLGLAVGRTLAWRRTARGHEHYRRRESHYLAQS